MRAHPVIYLNLGFPSPPATVIASLIAVSLLLHTFSSLRGSSFTSIPKIIILDIIDEAQVLRIDIVVSIKEDNRAHNKQIDHPVKINADNSPLIPWSDPLNEFVVKHYLVDLLIINLFSVWKKSIPERLLLDHICLKAMLTTFNPNISAMSLRRILTLLLFKVDMPLP